MLQTSHDILNIALATCITGLTIFLCVTLYYIIVSFKKFYNIIALVEAVTSKVHTVVDQSSKFINKVSDSSTWTNIIEKIMDMVSKEKTKRTNKKSAV